MYNISRVTMQASSSSGIASYTKQASRKLMDQHFPNSIKIDDYMSRIEILLSSLGFRSENNIPMINVCRDESTHGLKKLVEHIYGASFTTTGLGAVITCGKSGIHAGLSHSPLSEKERYLFFSYPHIGFDPKKEAGMGMVPRKGRLDSGIACGALSKCLAELKAEGIEANLREAGVHDPFDVEYSVLKQRLARTIMREKLNVNNLNLADITKVAERRITRDLERLIHLTVDPKKADYAVLTGVQIHFWTESESSYRNDYIWPTSSYVCVDGVHLDLDLQHTKGLSQRQLNLVY